MNQILLLLLSLVTGDSAGRPVVDTYERCELNYFYCENTGRLVLKQLILWDGKRVEHFVVVTWFIEDKGVIRLFNGGRYREFRVKSFSESHTDYDPEVENHAILSKDSRRGVSPR